MANIAILGFGNIGSGTLEVLRASAQGVARRAGEPVEVKYICDVRDFSSHPDAKLFVKDIAPVLTDESVSVVVETIGGTRFAYPMVKAALEAGKSVATSNKELVATHGAELLAIAREKKCAFLFEASVGGGMPLIKPVSECLAVNRIEKLYGIVNGTTNFMLTKMSGGMDFDESLREAQRLGYAETIDPSADVDGIDAQRKTAILASMLTGRHVHPEDVPTRGIRDVSVRDIELAESLGCTVRLIAWVDNDDAFACGVEPCLVDNANRIAGVEDVYNGVLIQCDMLEDVMFYGRGAGKLPTASSVVSDVADAVRYADSMNDTLFWEEAPAKGSPYEDARVHEYYVRTAQGAESVPGVTRVLGTQDGETAVLAQCTAAEVSACGARFWMKLVR